MFVRQGLGQEISEEKRIKILNWLWGEDFHARYKGIKEEHCKHTGKWFLDSDEYQSWFCGKSSWCGGIPGAGKTFISSFVIDGLERRLEQENAAIAFIYFNYQDQGEQNAAKIISCIIKQLVSGKTPLLEMVTECHEKFSGRTTVPDFSQLVDLLRSLSTEFSTIWIVLDALDECKGDTGDKVLLSLVTLDSQVFRLFATTRLHPQYPKPICQAREIALKVDIIPSRMDLELYTRQKLEGAKQDLQPEFIDTVVSKIVSGTGGIFLFLALQIKHILGQASQRGMKRALDKTPTSLNDLMVKKIGTGEEGCRTLAIKAITWISLSKRPLKTEEFVEALSVEEGDKHLDEENMIDIDLIVDMCAGLVTNDRSSGTIRLVHKTTQDYLSAGGITPDTAHVYITKTCITYLSFDCFDQITYERYLSLYMGMPASVIPN